MFDTKLLWIEEETWEEMHPIKSYLKATLDYEITIIDNASDVEAFFSTERCNVVLLDIRIPPGAHPDWCKKYETNKRLGLDLLNWISNNHPRILINLGIFTNESWNNISAYLSTLALDKRNYLQKQQIKSGAGVKQFIDKLSVKST